MTWIKGQTASNKGKGKAYAWLLAHVRYRHKDWCLIWPFSRDGHGRGILGVNGEHWWAHRLMCTLAKGKPPTPEHTAAHNCGNGHEGCINPLHLDWKTRAENNQDCRVHGTNVRRRARLTRQQAQQIRDAQGIKTQTQLAAEFDVSETTVGDIWNYRTHRGHRRNARPTSQHPNGERTE